MGRDHVEVDPVDLVTDGGAEPVFEALLRAADLDALQADVALQCARSYILRGFPLEEVGELRICDQALDADLAPLQAAAVGELS